MEQSNSYPQKTNSLSFWQTYWIGLSLVLFVLGALPFIVSSWIKPTAVTVVGSNTYSFKPDEVSLTVTRMDVAPSVTVAMKSGETVANQLINKTKEYCGTGVDIKKAFNQVQPASAAGGEVSYQVANAFTVKCTKVEGVPDLVRQLYQLGATSVSNIIFTSKDISGDQIARKKAVADAKTEAKQIAAAAGKNLGRMVTVADDGENGVSTVSEASGNETALTMAKIKKVTVTFELW